MKDELKHKAYQVRYVEDQNLILIQGDLRLESVQKYDEIIEFITSSVLSSEKPINIDVTKLATLNSSGIAALGMFLVGIKKSKREVTLIGSRYVSWQAISLDGFCDINEYLSVEFIVHH